MRQILFFAFILAALPAWAELPPCPQEGCMLFPKDAGILNVHDFGAKGDGVADDTAAINAALTASGEDTGPNYWQDRIVYFPAGLYLVSSPVVKRYKEGRFGSGAILMGESRDRTVLRLKDNAPGYSDAANPKAVIFTTAKLLDGNATSGGKDYTNKGEGNDAYMNFVENLTVDVGNGNPGAIGVDYLANNMGALRNLRVYAHEGSGATGIALTRKWPGPLLLKNVLVEGFNTGIAVDNTEYGVTLESVILHGQKQVGLSNNHNMVSAHNLTVTDAPLAITNQSADGLITLEGANISGATNEAFNNTGSMALRYVAVSGYKTAFGKTVNGPLDGVYQSDKQIASTTNTGQLVVEAPPATVQDAPENWVNVAAYGAVADNESDATAAIRKAFATGAHTIYFPHGVYHITDNIVVPASVERIVGLTSTIRAFAQKGYDRANSFNRDQGMFRLQNTQALTIEKLAFDNSWHGDQLAVEAAGKGAVYLKDVVGAGVTTLQRPASGGKVFIENTSAGYIRIAGKQGVWAWQLNSEGTCGIFNQGAPLWVLGVKTEGDCTVVHNSDHAHTEIWGGLLYITGDKADSSVAAFENKDSQLQLSYVEEAFSPHATYSIHVKDEQNGITKNIATDSLTARNAGRMVPWVVLGTQ